MESVTAAALISISPNDRWQCLAMLMTSKRNLFKTCNLSIPRFGFLCDKPVAFFGFSFWKLPDSSCSSAHLCLSVWQFAVYHIQTQNSNITQTSHYGYDAADKKTSLASTRVLNFPNGSHGGGEWRQFFSLASIMRLLISVINVCFSFLCYFCLSRYTYLAHRDGTSQSNVTGRRNDVFFSYELMLQKWMWMDN